MSTMTGKPNVHEKGALAFDEKKRILRLTSFAATGGVGSEIVKQAANAHHEITAEVGNPKKLSGTVPDLQVITANLAAAERRRSLVVIRRSRTISVPSATGSPSSPSSLAPLSPGFDLDLYDRELRRPFPSEPEFAPDSKVWQRENAIANTPKPMPPGPDNAHSAATSRAQSL